MTAYDLLASRFVSLFLEMKAFSLFSILFGLGFAMQFDRLSGTGRPYYFLTRRLIALAVFGLCHLLFVWNGDILTEYALAGFIVLPLIGLPARALGPIGFFLLALYVSLPWLPAPVAWPDPALLKQHVSAANQVYAHGSYGDYFRFSIQELRLILPLHVYVFPRTLALFCFGAFLWKAGLFQRLSQHLWSFLLVAAVGIVAGLLLPTAATQVVLRNVWPALQVLAPIVLAVGYGAGIVFIALLPTVHGVLRPFAAVGRMAFTNYILQSFIFGIVFFGFGFGMFGALGAAETMIMGTAVYALQAIFSTYWLKQHQFGPLEWLWRAFTYGRSQPMRREKAAQPNAAR